MQIVVKLIDRKTGLDNFFIQLRKGDIISINPFKPNGISHSYQMDQSIFILILIEHSVSKQLRF